MLKNYFLVAFRSLVRNKSHALINLTGLTIGLSAVILIYTFVRYELSYDKGYSNSSRVYRLESAYNSDPENKTVMVPDAMGAVLKKELPGIEATTRLERASMEFLLHGERKPLEVIRTDNNFLKVFNLPLFTGGAEGALVHQSGIIIDKKTANLFFGTSDAIGRRMELKMDSGKVQSFIVSAIMDNIPSNTHFSADAVIADLNVESKLNWAFHTSITQYVLLNKSISVSDLETRLGSVYGKYRFPAGLNVLFDPVRKIHLHSNIPGEQYANGNIGYIYIFSLVAFLILFIACINYINLTMARSLKRFREAGIRQVMGAVSWQLRLQFIVEALLIFLLTLPFAFLFAGLAWPLFTKAVGIAFQGNIPFSPQPALVIFLICCISAILAGLYPSVFLSRLQPANILRGHQGNVKMNLMVRKALIVVQFIISAGLIISTVVVNKQLNYINNIQLGFNKEHLLELPKQLMGTNANSFKNELLKNSNISSVSISNWDAGRQYGAGSVMDDPANEKKRLDFSFLFVDYDFIKTMQMEIVEGRDFSSRYASDDDMNTDSLFPPGKKMTESELLDLYSSRSIILTESCAEALGLHRPFAGKVLRLPVLQGKIVGIVKDFQGISLHQKPPLLVLKGSRIMKEGYTYVRIHSADMQPTISYIRDRWKVFFPDAGWSYSFTDERIGKLYDAEIRLASLFSLFSLLAILIACSGLFSLAALMVQHRTKEIGVRKVFGASSADILFLFLKEFTKLVGLAIVIAIPIVWLAMYKWLEDFAFRIKLSFWIFLLTGLLLILLTLTTILFQAIRASVANPSKSLRAE